MTKSSKKAITAKPIPRSKVGLRGILFLQLNTLIFDIIILMITIILISIALAMDSFVVSVTGGALKKKVTQLDALKVGLVFGGFQAIMPLIGYYLSITVISFIENVDHWIAFGLLVVIGIKLLYEGIRGEEGEINLFNNKNLVILGIATSIDALAVGLSIVTLELPLITTIVSIGIVAFVFSYVGVLIGKKLGVLIKRSACVLGGVILIGIGVKILLEHL